MSIIEAPGNPGIEPKWTSSAKSAVGTDIRDKSHVWFTLSHGIINEIYYPRIDQACTRDMGLIITDGSSFFSEEKRDANHEIKYLVDGVPAFSLINTCNLSRYRIYKEIITDPERNTLLQWIRFEPLKGDIGDYHVYALFAPHIWNRGYGNNAVVDEYKGIPMLFAYREGAALALACSTGFLKRSVGFVGVSDGWQDIYQHKTMQWEYTSAKDGNVAAAAEIDHIKNNGEFILSLGFGRTMAEAGNNAIASLLKGFNRCRVEYIEGWRSYQESLPYIKRTTLTKDIDIYRTSISVLKIHDAKHVPGAVIASLSIPWGQAMGDDDIGGYHLIWPRDLVETAGGLLAAGDHRAARDILFYLMTTQEADGHWPQNMWIDGIPFWGGIQMDETAFPILLAGMLKREAALDKLDPWNMIEKAARFIICNGPVTQQDRWEEDPGYSPFTLSVEISALVVAAEFAEEKGQYNKAIYMRETADMWNASIERWAYVTDTAIARELGIDGYYVRISPPEVADAGSPINGFVPIKNRPPGKDVESATHIISTDFLALVRFGLRTPDNPRILNTLKAVDAILKVETPCGTSWHRYNDDGYGEHNDGEPFDGTGIGRLWPLLTGERAHYELQSGNTEQAKKLLSDMERFSNESGLMAEQVWDSDDIKEKELSFGRPSGSAMPLVWAHSEYIKLVRSIQDGKVFDMLPQVYRRYVLEKHDSNIWSWKFNQKCRAIKKGNNLRIETISPVIVHWSTDAWQTTHDAESRDTGLGTHVTDIETEHLPSGSNILFTFYWITENRWEGKDYKVEIKD